MNENDARIDQFRSEVDGLKLKGDTGTRKSAKQRAEERKKKNKKKR